MHINFPAAGQPAVTGVPTADSSAAKVRDAAPAAQAPVAAVPGSDARIISAAEAALNADNHTDNRINEIRQAIRSGLVRFDAEVLAANILRYHDKQD